MRIVSPSSAQGSTSAATASGAVSPMALVPTALIPRGSTAFTAYVGPMWMLRHKEGQVAVRRDAESIVVDSEIHGQMRIARHPQDQSKVQFVEADGTTSTGTLSRAGSSVVVHVVPAKQVTISPIGDDRIDISFSGFGALQDSMTLYLKRR